MATPAVNSILSQIGKKTSYDLTIYEKSTIDSIVSHINTFIYNEIDVTQLIFKRSSEISKILDSLHKRNSLEKLSYNYKLQLARTLNILNPELKYKHPRDVTQERIDAEDAKDRAGAFIQNALNLATKMTVLLSNVTELPFFQTAEDFNAYQVSIICLLITSTGLRISEVMHLKYEHIPQIIRGEPINIHTKKSYNSRTIITSTFLMNILECIINNKSKVDQHLHSRRDLRQIKAHLKQQTLFELGFINVISMSYLFKTVRNLAAVSGIVFDRCCGFNIFRKLTTTILTESGGHFVAKSFNNHKQLSTTLENYNVLTQQHATDTFNKMIPQDIQMDKERADLLTNLRKKFHSSKLDPASKEMLDRLTQDGQAAASEMLTEIEARELEDAQEAEMSKVSRELSKTISDVNDRNYLQARIPSEQMVSPLKPEPEVSDIDMIFSKQRGILEKTQKDQAQSDYFRELYKFPEPGQAVPEQPVPSSLGAIPKQIQPKDRVKKSKRELKNGSQITITTTEPDVVPTTEAPVAPKRSRVKISPEVIKSQVLEPLSPPPEQEDQLKSFEFPKELVSDIEMEDVMPKPKTHAPKRPIQRKLRFESKQSDEDAIKQQIEQLQAQLRKAESEKQVQPPRRRESRVLLEPLQAQDQEMESVEGMTEQPALVSRKRKAPRDFDVDLPQVKHYRTSSVFQSPPPSPPRVQ